MDALPRDIWLVVIQFLDDKTKRQMRLACTQLFNFIKYDNFVIYYMRQEIMPAAIERLSKYPWPIKLTLLKIKIDNPVELFNYISKLTNLVEIDVNNMDFDIEAVTKDQWMRLSVLTNLEVNQFFVDHAPIELLHKYTKLTEWTVSGSEEELNPVLKHLTNLNTLIFDGSTKTWPYALVPYPEKLTKLLMTVREGTEHGKEMCSRLTNLREIGVELENGITIDLKYATRLDTARFDCNILPSLTSNANLTCLQLSGKRWHSKNAEEISKLYTLEALVLYFPEEQVEPINLSFLMNLDQLRRFSLLNDRDNDISETVDSIYECLPNGVTSLIIGSNLDLDRLTHLTDLEALVVTRSTFNSQHLALYSNMTRLLISQNNTEVNLNAIAKLTKLRHLSIDLVRSEDPSYEPYNCNFLSCLTNLTRLTIEPRFIQETFWRNVPNLTKIQNLSIESVDNDNRLLLLTSLHHLTQLDIAWGRNFTGIHFTLLTSLQTINYDGDGFNLVHKSENIMKTMPYLRLYSCKMPVLDNGIVHRAGFFLRVIFNVVISFILFNVFCQYAYNYFVPDK